MLVVTEVVATGVEAVAREMIGMAVKKAELLAIETGSPGEDAGREDQGAETAEMTTTARVTMSVIVEVVAGALGAGGGVTMARTRGAGRLSHSR